MDGSPGAGPIKLEPDGGAVSPFEEGAEADALALLELWFMALCSFCNMAIISFELLVFPFGAACPFCWFVNPASDGGGCMALP